MIKLTLYRQELLLRGLVQGVGYRPFVRREAMARGIVGNVQNIGGGVRVCAYGTKEALDGFVECLLSSPPAGTRYLRQEIGAAVPTDPADCPRLFTVLASTAVQDPLPVIPPDIAPCAACLAEMADPANRRYRYPFQSCALCGPRYSVIRALPYDRERTAMADFPLCADCMAEYTNPGDRRSFAQTIACKQCGPRLTFLRAGEGEPIRGDNAALEAAMTALRAGQVVAVKNNGGFHLACRADDRHAVALVRAIKGREEKPFALLFADLAAVRRVAQVSRAEADWLTAPQRPIVLLTPKGTPYPSEVSGESRFLGAMLPSTPLQVLLAEAGVLVMTSANRSGEPICTTDEEVQRLVQGRAVILTHNRPIETPQDDSLLFVEAEKPCFLRRARGFAPLPICLPRPVHRPMIAMGGDLKGAFALLQGDQVYLSQHIGDLADGDLADSYRQIQHHLMALTQICPTAAIADAHPGYFSRQEALITGLPVQTVYHHHAHIASVMAEHRLDRVLGVALDGTGYGEDGKIWGGELLLCEGASAIRLGHLHDLPMPMGDAGAKSPALLSAYQLAGAGVITPDNEVIDRAIRAGLCLYTSSMGRLFDTVSAILGLCGENSYEGRAPVLLENAAADYWGDPIELTLPWEDGIWRTDLLIGEIYSRKADGAPVGALALGFHIAVAEGICQGVIESARRYRCSAVALSGGCFANRLLLSLCRDRLERAGLQVWRNEAVPVGDGGIALGQAYLAACQGENGRAGDGEA